MAFCHQQEYDSNVKGVYTEAILRWYKQFQTVLKADLKGLYNNKYFQAYVIYKVATAMINIDV